MCRENAGAPPLTLDNSDANGDEKPHKTDHQQYKAFGLLVTGVHCRGVGKAQANDEAEDQGGECNDRQADNRGRCDTDLFFNVDHTD